MAKGGGTQTQNVTQTTSLPAYAQPYYQDVMSRMSTMVNRPYQAYQDAQGNPIERIAGFTPEQQRIQGEVAGLQTPNQFGQASNIAQQAGLASLNAGQYTPGQFNVDNVSAPNLNYFQMGQADKFGNEQAQQYMSPYVQNVLDIQKREAQQDAQRTQLMQNLGAARQGTYGGSRQLIAGLTRERALGQQMGDIQAKGLQSAYENAQQQFERDRNAGFNVNNANLNAALGVQQLGANTGLQAALANQQYGLEGQRLGEQSRQFANQQGLAGLAQAGQLAQTLGNLGQYQQQGDLSRLSAQQSSAAQQQALEQQRMSQQYQDFLTQRDYPLEMLRQYSGMLNNVPVSPNTNTSTSAPAPSLASQIMGTGLGALGMYKSLSGG